MKIVASIAFLAALVAPIFAVPFEQLEGRQYYDDNTSTSTVHHTKTSLFAIQTTHVPPIHSYYESLIPSDRTIVHSATTTHPYRAPHHTSAREKDDYYYYDDDNNNGDDDDDEHKHTRPGYAHRSGSGGFAHHTHHTRSSYSAHPTDKPDSQTSNYYPGQIQISFKASEQSFSALLLSRYLVVVHLFLFYPRFIGGKG